MDKHIVKKKLEITDFQHGTALAIVVVSAKYEAQIVSANADGTITVALADEDYEVSNNQALINYLSELLSVPIEDIEILAGKNNHKKLVSILDISANKVQEIILNSIENNTK